MQDYINNIAIVEEKIKYLCKHYPDLIHERSNTGLTPLNAAISLSRFKGVSAPCRPDGQAVRDKVIHPDPNDDRHLTLPLHMLVSLNDFQLITPLYKEADCLRVLLSYYPEAAGIEDGHGFSPYDHAVSKNCCPYVQSLLLRADPPINPAELHRLNYSELRMAMFFTFTAIVNGTKLTVCFFCYYMYILYSIVSLVLPSFSWSILFRSEKENKDNGNSEMLTNENMWYLFLRLISFVF